MSPTIEQIKARAYALEHNRVYVWGDVVFTTFTKSELLITEHRNGRLWAVDKNGNVIENTYL